jgi:hypothetical protein
VCTYNKVYSVFYGMYFGRTFEITVGVSALTLLNVPLSVTVKQITTLRYQHNETNVMHFSFSLLRIKGLYMFRALLADPQEVLHKRYLVYFVRIMSVGCATIAVTATVPQPTDIIRTQYTKCRLCSASWGWASNARNTYRPLILNKLNEKCIALVSLCWYAMMHGQ